MTSKPPVIKTRGASLFSLGMGSLGDLRRLNRISGVWKVNIKRSCQDLYYIGLGIFVCIITIQQVVLCKLSPGNYCTG